MDGTFRPCFVCREVSAGFAVDLTADEMERRRVWVSSGILMANTGENSMAGECHFKYLSPKPF
jgi:hypothetical protein